MKLKKLDFYERPDAKALPVCSQGVLCESVTGGNEDFTEVPFTF